MRKIDTLVAELSRINKNIEDNNNKIDVEANNKKVVIKDIEFMEKYIVIINKKKERQNLKLNKIQLAIDKKIDELRNNNIPPRIIILKARQEGVTTYSQGKMMSQCVQHQDMNCLIVAHEKDSTSSIFSKTKFMFDNLEENVKPLQKASNARELVLDKPLHYSGKEKGLNSKIVIKIAGKESIGRGDTYSFVHMSEKAFWSGKDDNSPNSQLTAIMQALPETLESLAIIESTAKGYNDFKNVWDKAVSGDNGWCPLFFAWHDDIEYSKEFNSEDEKIVFSKSLDKYETEIKNQFKLSLEQINWYRYTKKVKCNNSNDKMKQENPSFPEEAFIFSGTPVFDNNIIMNRINFLEQYYKENKYITGEFKYFSNNYDGLTVMGFVKSDKIDKLFSIKIYEKAIKGYPYTIGGDTKGEGKDAYTATVVNAISCQVVAVMKSKISDSKKYTENLFCLGKYYNYALIGVEMNFNTSPIERLESLRYFRMYSRKKTDIYTKKINEKFGWKTDGVTRPYMIDNHVIFSKEQIECFSDIETLQEMLTFVKNEKGRPDSQNGRHDDLIFSHMIAMEIQEQQVRRIDKDSNKSIECFDFIESKVPKKNVMSKLWEKWENDK